MGHKKESHDHDERRKCRRQSNLPSTKRARKNRSCSVSTSVESKAYGKRQYYQSWSESLSHSSSESSLESSESLSRCPSPQKKTTEVAVNEIILVLNKQAIAKVKVILQLTKKRKISIRVSMKKKNAKADRGVDPLTNIEEGKNNHYK